MVTIVKTIGEIYQETADFFFPSFPHRSSNDPNTIFCDLRFLIMGSAVRIWLKYVYIGFAHNCLDICLAIGLHLMEMNQNQLHSF